MSRLFDAIFFIVQHRVAACAVLILLAVGGTALADTAPAPIRPVVFVPGLLGSKLCQADPASEQEQTVVWGSVGAIRYFHDLRIDAQAGNRIEPCGLIREVTLLGLYTQDVYAPFLERMEAAGYREGETLFLFDYDWRLSVFDNAERLSRFVAQNIPSDSGRIDLVAHSMGGLIARTYAIEYGGGAKIATLITAGTPWHGSVRVVELLQDGMGAANVLVGGLAEFRRTILSFPVMFELLADYDGCCAGIADRTPARPEALRESWLSLEWDGVDAATLPDLAEAYGRRARLRAVVDAELPRGMEDALVIGVDQRTPRSFSLAEASGEDARFVVETSWAGDGTVMRDSAALPREIIYPTRFARHGELLSDPDVQDFAMAALRGGPDAAAQSVPVRDRGLIATALGRFVELVGVAMVTDQPLYRTGQTARLVLHLRPDTLETVDASRISLTATRPDGRTASLDLSPAPEASDPANPYEQSFSATVDTGTEAGELRLTATIDAPGEDRVTKHVVPVIAR